MDAQLKMRPSQLVNEESSSICSRVKSAGWFQDAANIAGFLSMPHEVQTLDVFKDAFASGKSSFVPRVTGPLSEDMEFLKLGSYDEIASLPLDKWGIPTPGTDYGGGDDAGKPRLRYSSTSSTGASPFDLVLVPGVAFDRAGGRLGHGKGYYDAFLSAVTSSCLQRGAARPLFVVSLDQCRTLI